MCFVPCFLLSFSCHVVFTCIFYTWFTWEINNWGESLHFTVKGQCEEMTQSVKIIQNGGLGSKDCGIRHQNYLSHLSNSFKNLIVFFTLRFWTDWTGLEQTAMVVFWSLSARKNRMIFEMINSHYLLRRRMKTFISNQTRFHTPIKHALRTQADLIHIYKLCPNTLCLWIGLPVFHYTVYTVLELLHQAVTFYICK